MGSLAGSPAIGRIAHQRGPAFASTALGRVLADQSELAELSQEAEDEEEWRGNVQRLAALLQ